MDRWRWIEISRVEVQITALVCAFRLSNSNLLSNVLILHTAVVSFLMDVRDATSRYAIPPSARINGTPSPIASPISTVLTSPSEQGCRLSGMVAVVLLVGHMLTVGHRVVVFCVVAGLGVREILK